MAKTKNYTRGKKRTSEIQTLRFDDKIGKVTRGIFLQVRPMLTEAGEPVRGNFDQELHVLEMSDLDTGEVVNYWADGGIRGALKMGKIAADTPIEIEHTGEKKIEDGRVQTYDVFELKAE